MSINLEIESKVQYIGYNSETNILTFSEIQEKGDKGNRKIRIKANIQAGLKDMTKYAAFEKRRSQ